MFVQKVSAMTDYIDVGVSVIALIFIGYLIMKTVKEIKDETR